MRFTAPHLVFAFLAFSSTAALSGFDEGVASYRAGNYADAFKEWTGAAQQGDVDDQYNLGCIYVRKACHRMELGLLTGFNEQPIRVTSTPQPGCSFQIP